MPFDFAAFDTTHLVTGALIALQLLVFSWVYFRSLQPLARRRSQISAFAKQLRLAKAGEQVKLPSDLSLGSAWAKVVASDSEAGIHREVVEPREALAPEALLPYAYMGRLDAAAPGVFTALGIVGTFIGLILAFRQVDPAQSEQSIAPLVSGMNVAFINSLVGVVLSILWAVYSRLTRDTFDRACRELVQIVEQRLPRQTPGDQVLQAFERLTVSMGDRLDNVVAELRVSRADTKSTTDALGAALAAKLEGLAAATQGLSSELLTTLAPQLERSFKSLVDTPFENLSRTVEQYRKTVDDVAQRHEEVLESLSVASAALGAAQNGLAAATEANTHCVQQFEDFVQRISQESDRVSALITERGEAAAAALNEQSTRAASLIAQSGETAHSLRNGVEVLKTAAERQHETTVALGSTTESLRTVSNHLDSASSAFTGAAARLEAAAAKIQTLGAETAQDTARAAREELQAAVDQMATALRVFGAQNIEAFESSSRTVVESVDERMSDLTDRLSAELNTLTVRLPEVAESMTNAAKTVRIQLEKAVRGLDDAVRQLDVASRQSLKARLEEYDGAVAKAVDHFSGTLLIWDGRVNELSGAVRRLESVVSRKSGKEREDVTKDATGTEVVSAPQEAPVS